MRYSYNKINDGYKFTANARIRTTKLPESIVLLCNMNIGMLQLIFKGSFEYRTFVYALVCVYPCISFRTQFGLCIFALSKLFSLLKVGD